MEPLKTSVWFFLILQRGDDMGRFYGTKIKNAEINPKTEEAWTIEDVPRLWKNATQKWLNENQ